MKKHFLILLFFFIGFQISSCKFSDQKQRKEHQINEQLTYVSQISEQKENAKTLILLHGLGSDEKDLFPLGKQIGNEWNIFSLRGPLNHTNGKYSWYKLNLKNGATDRSIEDVQNSTKRILDFIEYAKRKYEIGNEIYIGGFSQGSIMSLYAGLSKPEIFDGMACFSGLLLDDINNVDLDLSKIQELNVFMSHGISDNVISVKQARKAKAFLEDKGVPTNYKEYDVRHTISRENLKDFLSWVKTL